MNIAIIGAGNLGSALSQQLISAGHDVKIGVKFPLSEKSMRLSSVIGEDHLTPLENAVKMSDVVIFTIPADIIIQVLSQLENIEGKTIIDATNSVRKSPDPYPTAYHAIKAITNSQRVVKCFNSTGYENILAPIYKGDGIDMFCAGDDLPAKQIAQQLAMDIGFANCYDFGGDDKVELLEKLALCWINLAIMQGHGRDVAFKLLRR